MEAKVDFEDIWGCSVVPAKLAFFSSKYKEQNLKNAACAQQLFLTSPALLFKKENFYFIFVCHFPPPHHSFWHVKSILTNLFFGLQLDCFSLIWLWESGAGIGETHPQSPWVWVFNWTDWSEEIRIVPMSGQCYQLSQCFKQKQWNFYLSSLLSFFLFWDEYWNSRRPFFAFTFSGKVLFDTDRWVDVWNPVSDIRLDKRESISTSCIRKCWVPFK